MFGVQLYKNNARALLSPILSILNLDWLQHARSVRGVYECFIWQCPRPPAVNEPQGSLKGESVVAAILSSRMEQSYCTSGFFRFQARFLTSSTPILTITHYLHMCFTKRVTLYSPPVVTSMSLSNDSNCVTTGSAYW